MYTHISFIRTSKLRAPRSTGQLASHGYYGNSEVWTLIPLPVSARLAFSFVLISLHSIQYVCSTVRAHLTLSYGFFQVTGKAGSRGARIKEI